VKYEWLIDNDFATLTHMPQVLFHARADPEEADWGDRPPLKT